VHKLTFLVGLAVGYVFGARAGRARYEQISEVAARVAATDTVQRARETAVEQATYLAEKARTTVGDKVGAAVAEGRHKVEEALGDKLPERLRSTEVPASSASGSMTQPWPSTANGAGAGI
jgi:hypothetical protein